MVRIFVKHNRELDRQVQKRVAPLSARKDLQENIRRETGNAKNQSLQDRYQANKEAKKWQNTLDKNCPETLSVEAKNAMWKRAKELKDDFTVGMLSTDELHPVTMVERAGVISTVVSNDKMQNVNSVQRELAWQSRNDKKVKEYKNIMRHLNPDNPAATDINKFRPIGRIK